MKRQNCGSSEVVFVHLQLRYKVRTTLLYFQEFKKDGTCWEQPEVYTGFKLDDVKWLPFSLSKSLPNTQNCWFLNKEALCLFYTDLKEPL